MDDDKIKVGDVVSVYWDDDEGTHIPNATITHVPQDTGDMWHLKDQQGNIHAVNPSCHTLKSIVKSKSTYRPLATKYADHAMDSIKEILTELVDYVVLRPEVFKDRLFYSSNISLKDVDEQVKVTINNAAEQIYQQRERWISIKDKLSEDFVRVLVRRDNTLYETIEDIESGYYSSPDLDYEEGKWFTIRCPLQRQLESIAPIVGGEILPLPPVTHWMPLPEPPKENKDEQSR